MALSQSTTCTQVSTLVHADLARPQSPKSQAPATATPLKDSSLQGASALRTTGPQTRSMAAPKAPKASTMALKELAVREDSPADVDSVADLVSQVSQDIGDAVESVLEDPPSTMRVRRSSGKSATRTSRRRALVMCLALGMVRPAASNVAGGLPTGTLRRTGSSASGLRRSASGFTVSGNLTSQVSIASSLKAANLLEDKEDDSAQL